MRQFLLLTAGFGWWPIASAVLVAACAFTAWRRRDPGAWAGLVALVAAAVAVLALRLVVSSTAEPCALIGLVKPSGHAALAAVVYGTIGFVYGRHLPAARRRAARIVCLVLMIAVPAAMVGLGFHSVSDVLVGAVAGLTALGLSRPLAVSWGRPTAATVSG
jgi:membrane-associated phospholipid phosphatase